MLNFFKNKFIDESLDDQKKDLERFHVSLSAVALSALDCDKLPNGTGEFGRSVTNPIPVNGPMGEIKYINRLRTEDGGLMFHRLGSFETIDVFEVVSIGGNFWDILYLDMYHPRRSVITPAGYTFSKFHEIYSRYAYGYCTNAYDSNFPFGLSQAIEKGLGGPSLVKKYEEVIKDRSKFVRPLEQAEKIKKLNLLAN